ncbi:MAG: hypothetical protein JWM98_1356 [Thermoleophilia bacterium]|nr:hypothetical protein [Thermoleophilia bacterium]
MPRSSPDDAPEGAYFLHAGRRWRATDPRMPDAFAKELTKELMDARRAVKPALAAEDAAAEERARARVQDAKVALGERGPKWWEELSEDQLAERMCATIHALLRHRAPESTICPSDVARVVGGEGWRDQMDLARATAFALQDADEVEVRHAGERVDRLADAHGPLRIARAAAFPDLGCD